MMLDPIDRQIVLLTQGGLPVTERPYDGVAEQLGLPVAEVVRRMKAMRETGVIRRISAVPNHYALGYRANGMTVWDVNDDVLDDLGPKIGGLEFVSHCYQRPRQMPIWPFNLFAMIHGMNRRTVEEHANTIAAMLGEACREHRVLYSKRILKKTGLRVTG